MKATRAELGVTDVRWLDYDDSIPIPDREIIIQISEIIREVQPDIIVTHHPNDSVVAHGMTTQMVLAAMAHSSTAVSPDLEPHYPMQVFFHTQIGDTDLLEQSVPRIPDTIIDITDVVKTKARTMNHFKSQSYGVHSRLQRKTGEMVGLPQPRALFGGVPRLQAQHVRIPTIERVQPEAEEPTAGGAVRLQDADAPRRLRATG